MKLSFYNERLLAMLGEDAGGGIPLRVEWEQYSGEGKFVSFGSDNATTIEHTTQTVFLAYGGTDDGSVRKLTGLQFVNSDVGVEHTINLYLGRRSGGVTRLLKATVPSLGALHYSPEQGWVVYSAAGLRL
jgi:hypothetical protein